MRRVQRAVQGMLRAYVSGFLAGLLCNAHRFFQWAFGGVNANTAPVYKGTKPSLPRAIAVVWAEEALQDSSIAQIADILQWCNHDQLQHFFLYEPSGNLKTRSQQLEFALPGPDYVVGWCDRLMGSTIKCLSCRVGLGSGSAVQTQGQTAQHAAAPGTPGAETRPAKPAQPAVPQPPCCTGVSSRQLAGAELPSCSGAPGLGGAQAAGCCALSTEASGADQQAQKRGSGAANAEARSPAVAPGRLGQSPAKGSEADAPTSGAISSTNSTPISSSNDEGAMGACGCDHHQQQQQQQLQQQQQHQLQQQLQELCGGATIGRAVAAAEGAIPAAGGTTPAAGASGCAATNQLSGGCEGGCQQPLLAPRPAACRTGSCPGALGPPAEVPAGAADEATGGLGTSGGPGAVSGPNGTQSPAAAEAAVAAAQVPAVEAPQAARPSERRVVVHVLSAEDGYLPVLLAARAGGVCSSCGAVVSLKAQGQSYREGLARLRDQMSDIAGPAVLLQPELVLVVGPALTLAGYPALQVGASEILHLGPSRGLCRARVQAALDKFLMTEQRFGK